MLSKEDMTISKYSCDIELNYTVVPIKIYCLFINCLVKLNFYFSFMITCILDNTPDIVVKSLLEGGTVTKGVIHRHLLPLLAAHASDLEPLMLLYPKCSHGTLKTVLLKSRESSKSHSNRQVA